MNANTAITRWQGLVILAVVLLAFLLLAFRSEANAHDIRVSAWNDCGARAVIIQQSITQQEALAKVEEDQNTLPDIAARRIQIYRDGIPKPADCGTRPRIWWER